MRLERSIRLRISEQESTDALDTFEARLVVIGRRRIWLALETL
jgi:hypothetical protein